MRYIKLKTFIAEHRAAALFAVLFAAIFIRFIYYGFEYFPQLDDYIQYHNYATSIDFSLLITQQGLLSVRPLAGIADVFLWSKLYSFMIAGVLIISLMSAAAAVWLYKIFNRHFGTGILFAAVCVLLPLGFEGTYWMSASTRIVCGLFFAALAGYLFDKICAGSRLILLLPWAVCQLCSFCFYEQALVFSLALTFAVGLCNLRSGGKRPLFGLISLANLTVFAAVTLRFAGGTASERVKIALPVSEYYFKIFLPDITGQLYDAFVKGGFLTLFKGFLRGAGLIASDFARGCGAYLYMAGVLLICFIFYLLATAPKTGARKKRLYAFACGIFLAAAPVAPFFIISDPWFSLRGTVCAFPGIALAADAVFSRIFGAKRAAAAVTALFAAVCCVAGVSELHDYRETYLYDQRAVAVIYDELRSKPELGDVGVFNLNASYLADQNFYYHEHIHGVTHSGWALYGAVIAEAYDAGDRAAYGKIVPLSTDGENYWADWNRETKRPDRFDALYYWDDAAPALVPVYCAASENGASFEIYFADGGIYARIWEDARGNGHIQIIGVGA